MLSLMYSGPNSVSGTKGMFGKSVNEFVWALDNHKVPGQVQRFSIWESVWQIPGEVPGREHERLSGNWTLANLEGKRIFVGMAGDPRILVKCLFCCLHLLAKLPVLRPVLGRNVLLSEASGGKWNLIVILWNLSRSHKRWEKDHFSTLKGF